MQSAFPYQLPMLIKSSYRSLRQVPACSCTWFRSAVTLLVHFCRTGCRQCTDVCYHHSTTISTLYWSSSKIVTASIIMQAVWPNNVNWQSCLLYGRERSGLLPEASIVTEPSCCGPTNSAHQECKTLEAALSPELSAASSSTGQCVMRSESSEALNSTQQDAVTESDPPSPLLSTKVSASKHFEDQQAMLGHKLSASLISQQAEIKSLSASSPELLAPSPEISTAFYSARGDFDGHRASLSAESSENLEPHMGPKARILHCTALLSQAQDPITERPARIPTTEVLCAKVG